MIVLLPLSQAMFVSSDKHPHSFLGLFFAPPTLSSSGPGPQKCKLCASGSMCMRGWACSCVCTHWKLAHDKHQVITVIWLDYIFSLIFFSIIYPSHGSNLSYKTMKFSFDEYLVFILLEFYLFNYFLLYGLFNTLKFSPKKVLSSNNINSQYYQQHRRKAILWP